MTSMVFAQPSDPKSWSGRACVHSVVAKGATHCRPSVIRYIISDVTESSMRRFYLYDVLLHQLGHHVDGGRSRGEVERYAQLVRGVPGGRPARCREGSQSCSPGAHGGRFVN